MGSLSFRADSRARYFLVEVTHLDDWDCTVWFHTATMLDHVRFIVGQTDQVNGHFQQELLENAFLHGEG